MSWLRAPAAAVGNDAAHGPADAAAAQPGQDNRPPVVSESEAAQALEGADASVESRELDAALSFMSRTGCVPREEWAPAKAYLGPKLRTVCAAFSTSYGDDCPRGSGNPSFDELVSRLVSRLEGFDAPPFTIQRLCELLLRPADQYRSTRKLLFALRRLLSVEMTTEDERELEPTSLAPPFSHHLAMPATFLGHEVLREVPAVRLKPSALQRQGSGASEEGEGAGQGAHPAADGAADGTGADAGAAGHSNGGSDTNGAGGASADAAPASGPAVSSSTAAAILQDDAAQWPSGAHFEGPPSELSPRKPGRARARGMDEEDEDEEDVELLAAAGAAAPSQGKQARDAASKPPAAQEDIASTAFAGPASEGSPTNGRS